MADKKKSTKIGEQGLKEIKKTKFAVRDSLEVTDPDPHKKYRWLNMNKLIKNNFYDHRGWTLRNKMSSSPEVTMAKQLGMKGLETVYTNGDLVLGEMEKEKAEAIKEYNQEKTDVAINRIKNSYLHDPHTRSVEKVATIETGQRKGEWLS